MSAVQVTGDVHGHVAKLRELLCRAGLIDSEANWIGGNRTGSG